MSARPRESWKLTLPCTRAEAEAIEVDAGGLAALDPPPVLTTSEEITDDPDRWRLDAYFEGEPDAAAIAAVRALVPSAAAREAIPEHLPDADWMALSQAGLPPIRAARFFVRTGLREEPAPPGSTAFMIPAGRAFGTGHHETTAGCLTMLDAMKRGGLRVENLIDLGTGTGLLAFAALSLWPRARATATDIDPVAIEVTAANAARNRVAQGRIRGQLALTVADGATDPLIRRRAHYDLVIANILAAPLIDLAPAIAAITTPDARIVLAGLLRRQADTVVLAYRRAGFRVTGRLDLGDWTILRLRGRRGKIRRRARD